MSRSPPDFVERGLAIHHACAGLVAQFLHLCCCRCHCSISEVVVRGLVEDCRQRRRRPRRYKIRAGRFRSQPAREGESRRASVRPSALGSLPAAAACGCPPGAPCGALRRRPSSSASLRGLFGHRRFALAAARNHRVGNARHEQLHRAQRIVVARDDVVDLIGIAVGVDDADHRNLQLARFVDGDLFLARVDRRTARRAAGPCGGCLRGSSRSLRFSFSALAISFFGIDS